MVFCLASVYPSSRRGNSDKPAGLERRLMPQMHGNHEAPTQNCIYVVYE
jgi:hypothetical protein